MVQTALNPIYTAQIEVIEVIESQQFMTFHANQPSPKSTKRSRLLLCYCFCGYSMPNSDSSAILRILTRAAYHLTCSYPIVIRMKALETSKPLRCRPSS